MTRRERLLMAARERQARERQLVEHKNQEAREAHKTQETREAPAKTSKGTSRDRLRARAQSAERDRQRAFGERSDDRPRLAKTTSTQKKSKTTPSTSKGSGHVMELSMGLSGSQCESTGPANCEAFEQGFGLDLAANYLLLSSDPKSLFGWNIGLDVRYVYANFTQPDVQRFESYTMNSVSVGSIAGVRFGTIYVRGIFGVGVSSGAFGVDDRDFDLEFSSVTTLVTGTEIGWRMTPNIMISGYRQAVSLQGEEELCDTFGGQCGEPVPLPPITQSGLRLSVLF